MLQAGAHTLELTNPELEFTSRITVQVPDGKTSTVQVPVPNGSLSVNAVPWADVAVDGRLVGTTPLANLPITIGSHEVIMRHPQLGERRRTVVVTAQSPTRLGTDFSK